MKKALCILLLLMLPMTAFGETLTLSFVGDCSIGEAIQYQGNENGYTWMMEKNGYDWPFSLVREYLDNDDFTFANLEVVITERTRHVDKVFPLVAGPGNAQALLSSGIDAVNTVNNHCFDFYVEGYQDTIAALDQLPMKHFGSVYIGGKYAQDVLLETEVKGVKIGALGFTYPQDTDIKLIKNRIEQMRADGCEIIVASMHWGQETHPNQNSWQMKLARQIIDAGADIIWGHHPHVLQPVQFYKGGLILYSTGNFTFGSMSSSVDRDTGIFQVSFDLTEDGAKMSKLKVIPCTTTGSGDYRPYEFTETEDRERVFKKLIYTKNSANMQNLPENFLHTGEVQIENGLPVE